MLRRGSQIPLKSTINCNPVRSRLIGERNNGDITFLREALQKHVLELFYSPHRYAFSKSVKRDKKSVYRTAATNQRKLDKPFYVEPEMYVKS